MPTITSETLVNRAAATVREHAPERDQALLLALLEYAPSEKGRINVANKILHCGDVYKGEGGGKGCHLQQLADFFWRNLILPVRVSGGKTPGSKSRVSRGGVSSAGAFRSPAETEAANNLKCVIETASKRDRYKCVISGKVDPETIATGHGALLQGGTGLEVTRVTHIIPFSLRNDTDSSASGGHLPSIWCALECFGGTSLCGLMYGGINGLDNVITLSATISRYFTEMQVALEPVSDAPQTYRVRTWGKVAPQLGLPKSVTLTSATGAPLPNPTYLSLHSAICRLLWASARAGELEEVLEDLEEVTLLAPDGSSASLINIALYRSLAAEE